MEYKCDFCAKSFTGLVCFQQHEASEKHKKKVRLMNGATFEMPESVGAPTNQSNCIGPFSCPVCNVAILSLDNYQKHVISLDHALKVQQKNGDLLSHAVSSTFELKTEQNQPVELLTSPIQVGAFYAECKPCQKQFSGPEPYQQHLVSAGHRKKCGYANMVLQSKVTNSSVGNEKINNDSLHDPQSSLSKVDGNEIMPQTLSASNELKVKTEQNQLMEHTISLANPIKAYAECKPCQKQFSGPEPYQQHMVSAGHKKKCGTLNEIMQCDEINFSAQNKKINNILYDPKSSVAEDDLNKEVSQPFAKCDICKMQFNGPLPYHLHMVSDDHKKKAGEQLMEDLFTDCQSAFKCDFCVMKFSGPVPYQQHLVSNGHKKKINAAELSKQLATTGASPTPDSTLKDNCLGLGQSNMNNLQNWYCDVCKKNCSGPIPYNTHISGRDHLKNVRILEVEKNLRKIKELSPHDEIDSNLSSEVTSSNLHSKLEREMNKSSVEFMINDLNINAKSEDTKILSDKLQINANDLIALPNLNIIPPEKLDVSVFGPDDEIVFSSPKKCRQQLLSEVNEVKCVIKKEINENNYLMVE